MPIDKPIQDTPFVSIAGRDIGAGRPVFVVAEAGVNHDGNLEKALALVDVAKESGADAVKFQVFRASDLTIASAPAAEYQKSRVGVATQADLLSRLELTEQDFQRVRERCRHREILFLATPFSLRDLERLLRWNPAAVKLASTDLTNRRLQDAAAGSGLPIIISTGASTIEEMDKAMEHHRNGPAYHRLILMHCVSCYPTPLENIRLAAVRELQRRFNVPCGLSDHTTSIRAGGWAVAVGACVLEKHLTLDSKAQGPDHAMSLNPTNFREYVAGVREVEKAMGDGRLGMCEEEIDVRKAARKSIVSEVPIARGARITETMLSLKRPGTGIGPESWGSVVGRRAKVDIPADALMSWEWLE